MRARRERLGVRPVYGRVDTCAAEFVAHDAVSVLDATRPRAKPRSADRKKVIILGGGPNRIGQGIEFDYCCVTPSSRCASSGIETVMVNCNPETVSTDYDTSDRLYFEPLTLEDVLAICRRRSLERGELLGVIVQFGGQTPLKLAVPLEHAGVQLLGTPADAIDRAEDRERFDALLTKLGLKRRARHRERRRRRPNASPSEIGYPVLVRPELRARRARDDDLLDRGELEAYVDLAIEAAREEGGSQRPAPTPSGPPGPGPCP